jgi:hypothetical protein
MKDALLAAARARMEGVGRKLAAVAGALPQDFRPPPGRHGFVLPTHNPR